MSRKKRLWHPQLFYHVVMRGNNRQNIFNEQSDINEFFRVLAYVYDKHPFTILSYCIMTNHYHLLIRSSEVPLSKIMMLVNKRYTDYYKKKYRFCGQLYEKRYYADEVFSTDSLLEVSRYIHRNPIETKEPMVKQMEHYPYSSYHLYKYNRIAPHRFIDTTQLATFFKVSAHQTNQHLCLFTEDTK